MVTAGEVLDQPDGQVTAKSEEYCVSLDVFPAQDVTIYSSSSVVDVRSYLVCCILKGVDLSHLDMFKRFIAVQVFH